MNEDIDNIDPDTLLELLANGSVRTEMIPRAIVRIGKPYNEHRIRKAQDVITRYLDNPDAIVRHEAIWFLGCWAKSKQHQPELVRALSADPDPDNRGFAATCLGALAKVTQDPTVLKALACVVTSTSESSDVRLKAYAGLLAASGKTVGSEEAFDFALGQKALDEIDWEWVRSLQV